MNVKLISYTRNPITQMYLAAKRCVTSGDVMEHANDSLETKLRVIDKCIRSGHLTVCEFVSFVFQIEDISQNALAQLTRHRHAGYCVQSGRRVIIGSEEEYQSFLDALNLDVEEAANIIRHHFTENVTDEVMVTSYKTYHQLIGKGKAVENARENLPQGMLLSLMETFNFRSLIEMSKLRLCGMAQSEIRTLFNEIRQNIQEMEDYGASYMSAYLKPKCDWLGRCNEAKCCGHINGELLRGL